MLLQNEFRSKWTEISREKKKFQLKFILTKKFSLIFNRSELKFPKSHILCEDKGCLGRQFLFQELNYWTFPNQWQIMQTALYFFCLSSMVMGWISYYKFLTTEKNYLKLNTQKHQEHRATCTACIYTVLWSTSHRFCCVWILLYNLFVMFLVVVVAVVVV